MSGGILGITVAYVALAVLLLSLNVHSRWPAWVKLSATVLTGALYYVTYLSLEGLSGWPARSSLPQEFVMLSGYVHEPSKTGNDKGRVYLWVLSLEKERVSSAPRGYHLPYSPLLHREVEEAGKRLRRGIKQLGKTETVQGRVQEGDQAWIDEHVERIVIYDLPDPELPEK